MSFPFNVRIYGAAIVEGYLLVSDEKYREVSFTKLPGGGLEFGEGPADCLRREFKEETGLEIEVTKHIYTTDFFQRSAFNPNHQVISIYFQIAIPSLKSIQTIQSLEEDQQFRWVQLNSLSEEEFTFPIDKKMVPKLKGLV